jgi:hypothetical protein
MVRPAVRSLRGGEEPTVNVILRETGVLCIPSAGGEYSSTPLPPAGGAYQSTAGRKSPRAPEQLSISQWELCAHRGERGAAQYTFILVCVTAANGELRGRPCRPSLNRMQIHQTVIGPRVSP